MKFWYRSICTATIVSVLVIKVAEVLGPYKSLPHSRNYSVLALYFLRCISSKTGLCKPRHTEVLHSNYCFKKYLVLQQCSGWCRRIFSHSGFWVLDLLPRSVQTLLLVYPAKGRFFQPLFCHYRTPFLQSSADLFHEINVKCFNVSRRPCHFKMQCTDIVGKFSFSLAWTSEDFELRLQTISA